MTYRLATSAPDFSAFGAEAVGLLSLNRNRWARAQSRTANRATLSIARLKALAHDKRRIGTVRARWLRFFYLFGIDRRLRCPCFIEVFGYSLGHYIRQFPVNGDPVDLCPLEHVKGEVNRALSPFKVFHFPLCHELDLPHQGPNVQTS